MLSDESENEFVLSTLASLHARLTKLETTIQMDTDPAHHDINSPTNQSLAYLRECSLGRHGPGAVTAVTAVTAAIVGIRMARAVTAVTIVPAVTAVARRAFVDRGDRATVGAGAVTAKTGRAFQA